MTMPKKRAAGDRPFRMTILRDVGTTRDAAGHPVPNWQPLTKLWGGEEVTSGREFVDAKQVRPEISSIIVTNYDSRVQPSMRVQPKSTSTRTLEIVAAMNKGSFNVDMELLCKEAV